MSLKQRHVIAKGKVILPPRTQRKVRIWVKSKDNLMPKQRHFTAEGAEIAEEGIIFS
jgi:hypothetical protein